MQEPVASVPNEIVELLKEAAAHGQLVVIRASPPSHVDVRTPLLCALGHLFGLTPAESRALVELMRHQHVSRKALHIASSPDGNPKSSIKVLDVIVHKVRKKLAPHDIKIVNIYGRGFGLADGAHERIRRLVAKHDPGIILAQRKTESPERPHTD
jgi:hypothetical protein